MPKRMQDLLLERILDGDRRAAVDFIVEWAKTHSYEQAITEILEPVLVSFGKMWASAENVSLAQGYVAGKVAEDIMEKAAKEQAADSSVSLSKGPVVLGNIEDDCHVFGRKLVTIFLRLDGWKVYDLGEDVPAVEYVDKAVEVGAPIIAASAMMYRTALNIKDLRKEIDSRGLTDRIRLAVGGAVFLDRPGLVEEVGGDGTAANAITARDLMTRLAAEVRAEGKLP